MTDVTRCWDFSEGEYHTSIIAVKLTNFVTVQIKKKNSQTENIFFSKNPFPLLLYRESFGWGNFQQNTVDIGITKNIIIIITGRQR